MAVRPVLLGLVLCEKIIVEDRTKNITLVNQFATLRVASFPTTPEPFSVFATLTDGQGDVTIELALTHLGTGEEIARHRRILNLPHRLIEMRFHMRLHDCTFPSPGLYQFTLWAEGEWLAQRRLELRLKEDA